MTGRISPNKSLRRSMLFVPGNNPSMILAAPCFGSDAVILDLEDAVSPGEKDAARILVTRSLQHLCWGCEKVVRVNAVSTALWEQDVAACIEAGADTILLPKSDALSLSALFDLLGRMRQNASPQVIALIETARGIEEAYDCARTGVTGLFLGAEDLTADIGMERTRDGSEIAFARSRIVNAAAAAGIDAIDTPFTDVLDDEGLRADILTARRLGFSGKACIHPLQIDTVHELLAPDQKAVEWATRVIRADEDARSRGIGAVTVDGKMVDAPIVARAQQILRKANAVSRPPKGRTPEGGTPEGRPPKSRTPEGGGAQ